MLKHFAFVPARIYAAVFVGLMLSDYVSGGTGKVVQGLPIRLAIFAVVMTLFWWVRRRARAFR